MVCRYLVPAGAAHGRLDPKDIGFDLSVATIWRPKATQNIVGRLSGAVLLPGKGFKDLFDNKQKNDAYVSILANVILSF